MATKLEKPDPDKNSWEKYSFTLTTDLTGTALDQRQVYLVWHKGNTVLLSTLNVEISLGGKFHIFHDFAIIAKISLTQELHQDTGMKTYQS